MNVLSPFTPPVASWHKELYDLSARRTRIEPEKSWSVPDLAELWQFRHLLYFLVWRELKVRYKQTVLGIGWVVLEPLLYMAVLTVIFGGLAKIPSEGVPYPLFALAGLLPWIYVASSTSTAASSLVANYQLISKVHFPRLLVPLSVVLANAIDLLVGVVLLIGMLFFFGLTPSPRLALIPVFMLLAMLTSLAVSTWLSALDVSYRDIHAIIPFLIQGWMFATPVIYPAGLFPGKYAPLFGLNPMSGVVEGFRWAILPGKAFPTSLLAVGTAVIAAALVSGTIYFYSKEPRFADVI